MPDLKKANDVLDQIIEGLKTLKVALSEEPTPTPTPVTPQPTPVPQPETEDYSSVEALIRALESDKWPEAVNPNLICDPSNEVDKIERGRGVIELMIEEDLKGLKLLDYGCGEGHLVKVSQEYNPAMSVGFDKVPFSVWAQRLEGSPQPDRILYTNDYSQVQQNGPYDVVLLFDVIDHVVDETPVVVMTKAREVLNEKGKIYMRCHPYTSRHATHLYHELNKAYVHLIFKPEELKVMLPESKYFEPNIGVTRPLMTYEKWIAEAGLKIVTKREITEKPESFFKIPKVAEKIMTNANFQSFPEFQLSLQFVDYVLEKQ